MDKESGKHFNSLPQMTSISLSLSVPLSSSHDPSILTTQLCCYLYHYIIFPSTPNSSVLLSVQWADEAALWPNPREQVTPSVWGVQVALAQYGPTEMEYKSLGNFKFPSGHM